MFYATEFTAGAEDNDSNICLAKSICERNLPILVRAIS